MLALRRSRRRGCCCALHGWPEAANTWEPAAHLLGAALLREWRELCAARSAEAWQMDESVLEEEPINAAARSDAEQQAQLAARG